MLKNVKKIVIFAISIFIFSSPVVANQGDKTPKTKKKYPEHTLTLIRKDKHGNETVSTKKVFEQFGKIIRDGDIIVGNAHDFHNGVGKFKDGATVSLSGSSSSGGAGSAWPQSIVPYTFDSSFTNNEKNTVESTLSQLTSNTGIQFVQRTSQSNYIFFTYTASDDFAAGRSYVGMQGGKQDLSLSKTNGFNTRTITHEAGHALGYEHEHQRSDRDSHITVNWSNLDECSSSFDIDYGISTTKSYDISSVMHYSSLTAGSCVFDSSLPMFTDKSGANSYASSTLTVQDRVIVTEDYGHFPSVSNFNWRTDACYGFGDASWSPIVGATSYVLEYKSGGSWYVLETTSSNTVYTSIPFTTSLRVRGINSSGQYSANTNESWARKFTQCY